MKAEAKQLARRAARERRDVASAALGASAPGLIARHFLRHVPLSTGSCIAGYVAMMGEADPAELIERLSAQGHVCALPRVAAMNEPLVFHRWRAGNVLLPGAHGTREPQPDAPVCRPDIVLVPLLAFDSVGRRLGYGGGYYDRTLAALREDRAGVLAVGVAFSAQEAQDLPEEQFDERLDWVVTEKGAQAFGSASSRGQA
ncbi:5-formyltetrahydrofolate cyclo-ligase [Parvibaculum lavamentivorans DS-1]|uniref:5-formyltetrahydrofolate cyclo-ligase n=1 Tax=Parvibaculum lavamentivorans (strain DS-1 / DSM 13023 / NCIMB 13966) TaxID=402881 RepID=A7HUZ2_PARL1|nr:5-formyltetrahydrofolate cyclo-ligase [Parvibaculum lavamentivorans]ABS63725.1 5-formyltetrahydrofolate cyclo-ligase [Parvibaculum lavamentivorans DS-1]